MLRGGISLHEQIALKTLAKGQLFHTNSEPCWLPTADHALVFLAALAARKGIITKLAAAYTKTYAGPVPSLLGMRKSVVAGSQRTRCYNFSQFAELFDCRMHTFISH